MAAPHPVASIPGVLESVRLVRSAALPGLPVPWPRAQDLAATDYAKPSKDDLVIAISHAWPYQAHPDPNGEKLAPIRRFVEEAEAAFRPQGASLVFFDFLSTPQREYRAGQAPRTEEQNRQFAVSLKAFPQIYLLADTTVHLDVDLGFAPRDGVEYTVKQSDLRDVKVQQVGGSVQVTDFRPDSDPVHEPAPFDFVLAVDDVVVETVYDVERSLRRRTLGPPKCPPTAPAWSQCCAQSSSSGVVQMRKAPFGRRNTVPADVKGWVYLERFVSMVKAAMVPEAQIASVAFSNSQEILDQIFQGGRKLRAAAKVGKQRLVEVLQDFFVELDSKQFTATSLDKLMNLGGVGGLCHDDSLYSAQDGEVVKGLMRELVAHLAEHWAAETRNQEQRQLTLAVSRGDTAALANILEAKVDVNIPDSLGWTALHLAAKNRNVDNVRLLIERRADTTSVNHFGNCPALVIAFYSEDATMKLFELLAPTKKELSLRNVAGVSPVTRFAVWVMSEMHLKPFPPAQSRLEEFRAQHPDLLAELTTRDVRGGAAPKMSKTGIEMIAVDGKYVPVHIWEPGGPPKAHVVWMGLMPCCPLHRQEEGISKVAATLCKGFQAKIYVLSFDTIAALRPGVTVEQFMSSVRKAIEALPLGPSSKLFFVDDSQGMCTELIWPLQERLAGALVLGISCFWEENYLQTSYGPQFNQIVTNINKILTKSNLEKFSKMAGVFNCNLDLHSIDKGGKAHALALETAPEEFWQYLDLMTPWLAEEEKSNRLRASGILCPSTPFPVTLAAGAFASPPFHLEPMQRAAALLPGCAVKYIPYSKYAWCVEGDAQALYVAGLLADLLQSEGPSV